METRGVEELQERLDRLRHEVADLAGEASLAGDIARLEELRLQATEEKIAADLELRHHARVIAELEVLTRADPLRDGTGAS